MTNEYVREVGRVSDIDDSPLVVGVDYDSVTFGYGQGRTWCLTSEQAVEFASLFVAACWQAGRNAERMSAEAVTDADQE